MIKVTDESTGKIQEIRTFSEMLSEFEKFSDKRKRSFLHILKKMMQ